MDIQYIERDLDGRLSVIESVVSPRNFVEFFDLINRTEYSGSVHCFNVIDIALRNARHSFYVAFAALLHRHGYSFNRSGKGDILALCQRLRGLNLLRPPFAL